MSRTFSLVALISVITSVNCFAIRGPLGRPGRATFTLPTSTKSGTGSSTILNVFDIASTAGALDAFYHTQPYAAAFVTCSFKASAADLVVQSQSDDASTTCDTGNANSKPLSSKLDFDVQRNLGFLLYGGIYQGCVQEYLYNNVFPSVFGDSHSWVTVMEQVALDMIVLTPFVCLPVAYATKAIISADDSVLDGLRKYVSHVQNEGLLVRYWSIWAPVQVLTFGFVPSHLRIPFIAFVSFFWLMILSNISSQDTEPNKE